MKILWIKADFLHPTTRGGQIRTLEMLKRLHQRHEVHYVGLEDASQPEGVARAGEYCSRAYPIRHSATDKTSLAFAADLLAGLWSPVPVAVSRWRSAAMKHKIDELRRGERFDSVVCDFLFPSVNISDLSSCVLFQHNLESIIWQRRAQHAGGLSGPYLKLQASRMCAYERAVSRSVKSIVAVSEADAEAMRSRYGVSRVSAIPTGVDVEHFTAADRTKGTDLVFVGSMDWMPNVDGVLWFAREALPLIRRRRPDCSFAIVGRQPPSAIQALAAGNGIQVTGTVPDVRPHLWGASIAVVPLRIGGGTRLKIYEAMAARTPVVSTSIGAEGLQIHPGEHIAVADTPESFAASCLKLLENEGERVRMADAAWRLVHDRFTWEVVVDSFERLLT
ncbi:MAG TPA: glycosyltransferase [Bryobacteraceae bacterium]|nr:glycosyltransferase [Bryobacteraceae bacterium]